MQAPWALEEMKTLELHDERLNRRLIRVLEALAHQPNASIPAACGGAAEIMAGYRLFDNDKVTFDGILELFQPQRQSAQMTSLALTGGGPQTRQPGFHGALRGMGLSGVAARQCAV